MSKAHNRKVSGFYEQAFIGVLKSDSDIYSDQVLKYDGQTGEFLGTFISGVSLPTDLVFVTVPEASSMLGILAFSALTVVTLRKRKQRTKNSVQSWSNFSTQVTK